MLILVTGELGHRQISPEHLWNSMSEFKEIMPEIKLAYSGDSSASELPCSGSLVQKIEPTKDRVCLKDGSLCPVCRQRSQVVAALSSVDSNEKVFRVRTDFRFKKSNIALNNLTGLMNTLPSGTIALSTLGSRDPLRIPQPFFYSDWYQAGDSETLEKYFKNAECLLKESAAISFFSRNINYGRDYSYSPEQAFATSHLSTQLSVPLSSKPSLMNFRIQFGQADQHIKLVNPNQFFLPSTIETEMSPGLRRVQVNYSTQKVSPMWANTKATWSYMLGNFLYFLHPMWLGMRSTKIRVGQAG